jgi:hypothetical protein
MGLFHLGKGIVMLQRHAAGLAAAAILAVLPAAAFAGVYKCVGANGASTFSDKPCQLNGDLKQAEIGSGSALTNAMTRDRDRSIGESCSDMADRSRHCGININRTIYTHFQESCYGPSIATKSNATNRPRSNAAASLSIGIMTPAIIKRPAPN